MKKLFYKLILQQGLLLILFIICLPAVSQDVSSQNQNIADTGRFFTSFDSTKIYYEVRGTGDAVVLVHGFIVNGQSWKRTELYKDLLDRRL